MVKPKVITAVSVGFWAVAASTLIVDLPGKNTDGLLYAAAVATTILHRTRRTDHMRTMWQVAYNQGVHDTAKRAAARPFDDSGPQPLGRVG